MRKKITKSPLKESRKETVGIATKFLKEKVTEFLTEIPVAKYAYSKARVLKATYYKWRKIEERFRYASDEAIIQGKISINDLAKSQIVKKIQEGNITAAIFWLKNNDPDFNPKVVLEIQRKEESLSDNQIKEIKTAMLRVGLANVFENEKALKKKFMKSKDFDQKFKEELEGMKKNIKSQEEKPPSSS